MTDDYTEFEAKERRLALLKLLAADADYEQNEDLLAAGLEAYGLKVDPDELRRDLDLLQREVCITIRTAGDYWIAKLTRRGGSVAKGLAPAQGVARPQPGRA